MDAQYEENRQGLQVMVLAQQGQSLLVCQAAGKAVLLRRLKSFPPL